MIKQQADQFGVGAKVVLKLAGGEKLGGTIQGMDEQAMAIQSERETASRQVAYD